MSLTGDPVEEIKSAKLILRDPGTGERAGIEVVSCPTCGRTRIDLIGLANQVENMVTEFDDLDVKVAVSGMCCKRSRRGQGGRHRHRRRRGRRPADTKGRIIRKVPESELLAVLREELLAMSREHRHRRKTDIWQRIFWKYFQPSI